MSASYLVTVVIPTIRKHGWMVQYVGPSTEQNRYAYTVGMGDYGLPDILVVGLPPRRSQIILNSVAEVFLMLRKAYVGDLYEIIRGYPIRPRRCTSTSAFVSLAGFSQIYDRHQQRRSKRGIQILLPDKKGRFAGQRAFDGEPTLL
jgi:hypothetical protein